MSVVLNTIEAFPNGRSTAELFALLDVDFDDRKRDSIRAELDALKEQGLIRLGRDGKWQLVARLRREPPEVPLGPSPQVQNDLLVAAAARFRIVPVAVPEEQSEVEASAKPEPQALLRYYRAAIRSDPRGALTQNTDSYGTAYVLLAGSGSFWPSGATEQGEIRIQLEALPNSFREALIRRDANENALAIGWPISMATNRSVPVVRPVGLIAGEWERADNELIVRVTHSDILVNPD